MQFLRQFLRVSVSTLITGFRGILVFCFYPNLSSCRFLQSHPIHMHTTTHTNTLCLDFCNCLLVLCVYDMMILLVAFLVTASCVASKSRHARTTIMAPQLPLSLLAQVRCFAWKTSLMLRS